ncbi:hypothetical protein MyNCGM683_06710 [Achromobacter xylosoxidans]
MIKDLYPTLVQSISCNRAWMNAEPNQTRQYLHEATIGCSQPFGKAVHAINRNLASWDDSQLSMAKAQAYAHDATQVELDELSNAFAFARSASQWFTERNAVGVTMNTLGILASGAIDSQNRNRGRSAMAPHRG